MVKGTMAKTDDSLRSLIAGLERCGELSRISDEVSPDLEIAAWADREMKSPGGGKALLFEKVSGSSMPVLVNAFGSEKRIAMALGGKPEELSKKIGEFLNLTPPDGIKGLFRLLPALAKLKAALPRKLKRGTPPCREVVWRGDEVDLAKLPVLTSWPGDGGPFITFPCVFTKDPATGRQNVGMYRLQVYDRNTTGMHWHIHKDGSASHLANKKNAKRTEVAVAIGADPAVTYAATAPMPHGMDELMLAGFLRGRPVELARCLTVDLWVPASSEIVLEGYVEADELRTEGPFGDHTGYYSPAEPYPVFHVTAMTHRSDPLYFTTVVGIPPMEDLMLGRATERLFLPLLRTQWPEVRRMSLPPEGVFHNLCLVSMEKSYPRQAHRLMSGFWGTGQMSFTKIVAVLDSDVDVNDPVLAAKALLNRLRIPQGLVFAQGVLDALDHASPQGLWGGKLGLDATLPHSGEPGYGDNLDQKTGAADPERVYSLLKARFPGLKAALVPFNDTRLTLCLLLVEKSAPGEGMRLAEAALEIEGVDVAVAVEGNAQEGLGHLLWRALSSLDPLRDIRVAGKRLAVDATAKTAEEGHQRGWPKEVSHPPEVVEKVRQLAEKQERGNHGQR